jgi:transglutaminase-like putative cysteine protease
VVTVPPPSRQDETQDRFGNRVTRLVHRSPLGRLDIRAISLVETIRDSGQIPATSAMSWEAARTTPADEMFRKVQPYMQDSSLVEATPALRDYATRSFQENRPLEEALADLMDRLRRDMVYASKATDASTTAAQALDRRAGVCQDFAHVAIACLRGLGLPARYVGGYLAPREDDGRHAGPQSPHAWCSILVPGAGWVDFDPTHGRFCGQGYVTVAWGRDYTDISPIEGHLKVGRVTRMTTSLDIMRSHAGSKPT